MRRYPAFTFDEAALQERLLRDEPIREAAAALGISRSSAYRWAALNRATLVGLKVLGIPGLPRLLGRPSHRARGG